MDNQTNKRSTHCTATTRQGQPCRAWAVPGTDPPRCAPHGGAGAKPGAPEGNQNAVTHGFYARNWSFPQISDVADPKTQSGQTHIPDTQDDVIVAATLAEVMTYITEDLVKKYIALSKYIDQSFAELTPLAMTHLLALHAQIASRIGRLLRDQKIIDPGLPTGMEQAINKALDELSEQFGTPL